jgi:hypothetical protein
MAPKKSRHWEHWIEVGRNTFQLVYYVINVISILAASSGLVFAYLNELQWGLMAMAVAVLCFAILHFYKQNLQEKGFALSNPHLWIDQDQMLVRVYSDKRIVKHQYRFRALRKVDRYLFKFFWSGTGEARVICEASPNDALASIPDPNNIPKWRRYVLLFADPLTKRQTKQIALTYELLDENHRAYPYQEVSYAHVAGCSKLSLRLQFWSPLLPDKVYVTKYSPTRELLERQEIPLDSEEENAREYFIEIEPRRGVKYHVEWETPQI